MFNGRIANENYRKKRNTPTISMQNIFENMIDDDLVCFDKPKILAGCCFFFRCFLNFDSAGLCLSFALCTHGNVVRAIVHSIAWHAVQKRCVQTSFSSISLLDSFRLMQKRQHSTHTHTSQSQKLSSSLPSDARVFLDGLKLSVYFLPKK